MEEAEDVEGANKAEATAEVAEKETVEEVEEEEAAEDEVAEEEAEVCGVGWYIAALEGAPGGR